MRQISVFYPAYANNGAHFLFMDKVLKHAESDPVVKVKAAAQVAALKAALAVEDENLKLTRKSLLTDEIVQADTDRDTLFRGYKKAVAGFVKFPVADMAQAARVLTQHLKDYAIDPKMQIDRETGLLVNFIADLEGPYKQQVATLSLTPFVDKLKAANDRVCTLTDMRTDERSTKTLGALKAARKASDEAYAMLVMMVNALAVVFGEADYAKFIDYMNTEITHYKREVLNQKAKPAETGGGSGNPGSGSDSGEGSGNQGGSGSDSGDTGGGNTGGDTGGDDLA